MSDHLRCEINVTPLVDVCLVMLIIFMVVTPMIVENVQLPRTERPDDKKPDRSQQIRLVVGDVKSAMRLSDQAGFHEFGCVVLKAGR